ncbi:MAG TPA: hypothetical protein VFR86_23860 [Burkholderiaceae bacterium]|nr:hypothetical protein [Burkholderiaceae bacterium]
MQDEILDFEMRKNASALLATTAAAWSIFEVSPRWARPATIGALAAVSKPRIDDAMFGEHRPEPEAAQPREVRTA